MSALIFGIVSIAVAYLFKGLYAGGAIIAGIIGMISGFGGIVGSKKPALSIIGLSLSIAGFLWGISSFISSISSLDAFYNIFN